MASSTISFSLFLALNCVLLSVSAIGVQDGIEVPASVPNANIPMTANEANTLSGEKKILPATVPGNPAVPVASVPNANIPMTANQANTLSGEKETLPVTVPVNPAVPFNVDVPSKPDMPNTPIVNNPVELIDKPEHFEQSMQNDDISNVDIKGEDNLKAADKIPTPVNAGNMNLVNVLNVLDDLKKKLDSFKEDIIQLALPIGMAAQMTVLKPEVEMSEVKPAEESNVAVEATPQQPNVSKNVNEPVKPVQVEGFADIPPREARSPYYGGGYGRPGYGGGYGRPGYGGGYGRPGYGGGYGGGYGRPGYGGGYGRPGYGGGYGRPGYGGGYGYGSN